MIQSTIDSMKSFLGNKQILFALILPLHGVYIQLYEMLKTAYLSVAILFRNDLTLYFMNLFFNQPFLQFNRVLSTFFAAFIALYQSK